MVAAMTRSAANAYFLLSAIGINSAQENPRFR